MSDTIGATMLMAMRAMPRVLMMFAGMLRTMGSTFTSFYIVLKTEDFLMMVMG